MHCNVNPGIIQILYIGYSKLLYF